jgi:hypothetical protein
MNRAMDAKFKRAKAERVEVAMTEAAKMVRHAMPAIGSATVVRYDADIRKAGTKSRLRAHWG